MVSNEMKERIWSHFTDWNSKKLMKELLIDSTEPLTRLLQAKPALLTHLQTLHFPDTVNPQCLATILPLLNLKHLKKVVLSCKDRFNPTKLITDFFAHVSSVPNRALEYIKIQTSGYQDSLLFYDTITTTTKFENISNLRTLIFRTLYDPQPRPSAILLLQAVAQHLTSLERLEIATGTRENC